MPFVVVSGVGRGMGVLDRDDDRRRGRAILGVNLRHPIVTIGDGDGLFLDYFGGGLVCMNCV